MGSLTGDVSPRRAGTHAAARSLLFCVLLSCNGSALPSGDPKAGTYDLAVDGACFPAAVSDSASCGEVDAALSRHLRCHPRCAADADCILVNRPPLTGCRNRCSLAVAREALGPAYEAVFIRLFDHCVPGSNFCPCDSHDGQVAACVGGHCVLQ